MAQELGNAPRAASLLDRLHRNRLFLERLGHQPPVYRYHPLFREFMLSEAQRTHTADVDALHGLTLEAHAAAGESAVDAAAELVAAKRAQLTALQDRLAAAASLLAGGVSGTGVYKLAVSGTGGTALLRNELLGAAGAPGPELSFCAGVALVGGAGSLAAIREVLSA